MHVLRTNKRNFGFADSSRLAMQWCACSKHIRVMQWLHVPGTKLLRVQVANAPTPICCRHSTCHLQTRSANLHPGAYLLGLMAMIKCSICSYECDNCYVSNWRLASHICFCWGSVCMSSLRSLHVLRWHSTKPVAAHPTRVTMLVRGL